MQETEWERDGNDTGQMIWTWDSIALPTEQISHERSFAVHVLSLKKKNFLMKTFAYEKPQDQTPMIQHFLYKEFPFFVT